MPEPTTSDRLALAVCAIWIPPNYTVCAKPCSFCRRYAAGISHEIAEVLRERHGGSTTADWLDGVGQHQGEDCSTKL